MIPVLEAVPNFSEGRDEAVVRGLADVVGAHDVDVLDWSMDADHHRSVITFIGPPADVEAASVAAARFAVEHIDMRRHEGLHPRTGALDVLPLVPLHDLGMPEAVASAHRVGKAIGELGVPVFLYGAASTPPGRGLAELRRGGFEALEARFLEGHVPEYPPDVRRPHPTAGATAVGARRVLLAWNVIVSGVSHADVREVAALIRERGGGFPGLRALGLRLTEADRFQVSMNLEDPDATPPLAVFDRIEAEIAARGGQVHGTEVIGMIPDALVLPGTSDRLRLLDPGPARVLSRRVVEHVEVRARGTPETSGTAE